MSIGSYHPGRFFSEARSGVPYETLFDLSIGRTEKHGVSGGYPRTLRLITFEHETSHLVHDLSVGCMINADLMLDEMAARVVAIVHQRSAKGGMLCPASGHEEEWTADEQSALERIESRQFWIDLFTGGLLTSDLEKGPDVEPSAKALLEGLVAIKTLFEMSQRAQGQDDLDYLGQWKHLLPLLPENLEPIYSLARKHVGEFLGPSFALDTDDDWPYDYLGLSPRRIGDLALMYLADLALHVPPEHVIQERLATERNRIEDFSPVHRFQTALECIGQLGGFPEYQGRNDEEGMDQYYRAVFDSIAHPCGWPLLSETNSSWLAVLKSLRDRRGSASDGYRHRLIAHRDLHPSRVVLGSGIRACMENGIPIVHRTPKGIKVFLSIGEVVIVLPEMSSFMAVSRMKEKVKRWRNHPREGPVDPEVEHEHAEAFQQEIIMRMLCRRLQDAVVAKPSLVCPLAQRGCEVAVGNCRRVVELDRIPQSHCALREYLRLVRINPGGVRWTEA